MGIRCSFNFLQRQSGFSLTEIMVGGAILAGVALASAQLFRDQKFAQKKIEYDQKLAVFHASLAKTLSVPANCNATFRTLMGGTPAAITAGTISNLYICNPVPGVNKCVDDNSSTDQSFDAFTPNAYIGTSYLATNQWIDNTQAWQVTQMQIMNGRTNTGPVTFRITYRLNPRIHGSKTVSKDIFLNVRFAANLFKECVNNQESSINNLQNDLCKTINLQENVTSDGRMAQWDEATQTCKITGTKNCAALGLHADGMAPDGTIKCKPIVNPTDAVDLQDTTTITCPAGQKPQPWYDTGAKKMKIRCVL